MAKLTLATLPLAPKRAPSVKSTDPIYKAAADRRWASAVKRHDGFACRDCGASGGA